MPSPGSLRHDDSGRQDHIPLFPAGARVLQFVMKVLVVKTSSLGDVVHTLPAITDAAEQLPGIRFDWVVEEGYRAIPGMHPAVEQVIPVAVRRWRRTPVRSLIGQEFNAFRRRLRAQQYDRVIDAQGLMKSAAITRIAHGLRCGFDRRSIREPLATLAYAEHHAVARDQHAITRLRQLFGAALGYTVSESAPHYGITREVEGTRSNAPALIFFHGTSWPSKHWPESFWAKLAARAGESGYRVWVPWGNDREYLCARRITNAAPDYAELLPPMDVEELAGVVSRARAVVGVDTGLCHLAAALGIPSLTLYGATAASRTGTVGAFQRHLRAQFPCAPCMKRTCGYTAAAPVHPACYGTLEPGRVWKELETLVRDSRDSIN